MKKIHHQGVSNSWPSIALVLCALSSSAPLSAAQIQGPVVRVSAPQRASRIPTTPPNIVFILADDFGVDQIAAYGEGIAPPCTPNLDTLARQGMLYRNAWANPICAPTRAAFLTGRYGFRTGMGGVGPGSGNFGLPLSELTLPEALAGYDSSCIGKWHLAGNLGSSHPTNSGFGEFAGILGGGVPDYFQWPLVENGTSSVSTDYSTTEITDRGIQSVQTMQGPWFLYLSYNAPHTPFHEPPTALCPGGGCTNPSCASLGGNPSDLALGKAMVEALDTEIGRFLAALDAIDPNAFVFFMGDNGSPRQLSQSPFLPNHAKGSVFEGGVNVPLIVRGQGVLRAESQALVSIVDLFATFTELASMPMATEDSVSIVPTFSDPTRETRDVVYAEKFLPNGTSGVFTEHERCVRDGRYKLIRRLGAADQMYDLELDSFETNNLLPTTIVQEQHALQALEAALVKLGVD